MTVTMDDVRRVLDPEEPDYQAAADLGPEALPHLQALVVGDDPMLASKATYAASLLEGATGEEVVMAAARSDDPVVRVAAAAAARNLPADAASETLLDLVADSDAGVRRIARESVPDDASGDLAARLEEQPEEGTEAGGGAEYAEPASEGGLMPGEKPSSAMPGETQGLMPGEDEPGGMPG